MSIRVDLYSTSPVTRLPHNALGALVPCEQKLMSLAGSRKKLRLSSDCGPGDRSRRTDQQWQKPAEAAVRVESAASVVRAVDFAQRIADVSGWTVSRSERRGSEIPDPSGIDGP